MTGRVTLQLPARRGGRRGSAVAADVAADVAAGPPDAAPAPAPERIPRVARVLALAHHWQGLIRSGAVRDQADLARLVGVSRARVTQVMSLLWLAPDIQEEVLAHDGLARSSANERTLRALTAEVAWGSQRSRWSQAIRQ